MTAVRVNRFGPEPLSSLPLQCVFVNGMDRPLRLRDPSGSASASASPAASSSAVNGDGDAKMGVERKASSGSRGPLLYSMLPSLEARALTLTVVAPDGTTLEYTNQREGAGSGLGSRGSRRRSSSGGEGSSADGEQTGEQEDEEENDPDAQLREHTLFTPVPPAAAAPAAGSSSSASASLAEFPELTLAGEYRVRVRYHETRRDVLPLLLDGERAAEHLASFTVLPGQSAARLALVHALCRSSVYSIACPPSLPVCAACLARLLHLRACLRLVDLCRSRCGSGRCGVPHAIQRHNGVAAPTRSVCFCQLAVAALLPLTVCCDVVIGTDFQETPYCTNDLSKLNDKTLFCA